MAATLLVSKPNQPRARTRSTFIDSWMLPLAWLLASVCVCAVLAHDIQQAATHVVQGSSCPPVVAGVAAGLDGTWGNVRSLFMQMQLGGQQLFVPGSAGLAAVAAHPSDLGLAVAVFLPHILLLLMVAPLISRWSSRDAAKNHTYVQHDPDKATAATTGPTMPAWHTTALSLVCDSSSTGATLFLAVAKLLPLVCNLLVALAASCGLGPLRPTSQALQLLHPFTPILTAGLTLLSQASVIHTLGVSMLHWLLAGILLTTCRGTHITGYLTPAQSWLALMLLDVLLPAALAWWAQGPNRAQQTRQSAASTSAASPAKLGTPASGQTPAERQSDTESSLRTPEAAASLGVRHRSSFTRAAEPASPAAALAPEAPKAAQQAGSTTADHIVSSPSRAARPAAQQADSVATIPGAVQQPTAAPTAGAAGASAKGVSSPQAAFPLHQPCTTAPALRTPVMDFEDALAACARGVAARHASGLTPVTALYQSQLHHHVISIKAPLDAALEGQQFLQLVLDQINTHPQGAAVSPTTTTTMSLTAGTPSAAAALSLGATSPPRLQQPPTSPGPMMLWPVAMRGCLHLLLPLCLDPMGVAVAAGGDKLSGAAGSCVLDAPVSHFLECGVPVNQQQQSQGPSHQSRSLQLCFQVDQFDPQLLTAGPDGCWRSQADTPCPLQTSPSHGTASCTAEHAASSSSNGGLRCWLEPPCVLLGPSTATGPTSKTPARPAVTVLGLPAAAGSLVRVLLVQDASLVADQLLPTALQQAGPSRQARSVRMTLPESGLCAAPAMVCVLSPPSSVAAAANAPAGVSPAVAAFTAAQSASPPDGQTSRSSSTPSTSTPTCSGTEGLKSARMWACLPLLLVDKPAVQEEFDMLFGSMCAELQGQQQHTTHTASSTPQAINQNAPVAALSPTSKEQPSAVNGAVHQVHLQHWQPFLWDWAYAVHGTDSSCLSGCIPHLAEQYKTTPPSLAAGGLYERAAVWSMQAVQGDAAMTGSSSSPVYSRQAITRGLLELLVRQGLPTTIKQLQAAVTAGKDKLGAKYSAAGSKQSRPGSSSSSPMVLSPRAPSQHDSCDSYNAAPGTQGWRPPVHCKDMTPSTRQRQLQQQQQKYIHTLEFTQQGRPPMQPQQQDHTQQIAQLSTAVDGSQPASLLHAFSSGSALPQPVPSAGLFDRYRRFSLDTLPLPYAPAAATADLHPPHWFLDLPASQHQQLFVPPSLYSTTSPTGPSDTQAAGAAAAAAGVAAAQAALLQLHSGGFISPNSLPSPAVRGPAPGRFVLQASPRGGAGLPHLQPQPSLGYSPSLASSNASVFMTAEASEGGRGGGPYRVPVQGSAAVGGGGVAPESGGGDPSTVEGRHWAVFDTSGFEGYDAGMDTTAGGNLVSTMAGHGVRSSANSVTWLAIPTSQAGLGLPPTALRTPRTSRHSAGVHSSSTGKLRRSDQQHMVSASSLTPQPPRSHSLSRNTAASADYLGATSTSSGTLSMYPGRRHSTRASLFSPATSGTMTAPTAGGGSQYEASPFSPNELSPPGPTGYMTSHQVGSFNTPQRPGPARFMGASPLRSGPWSPGGQMSTLPTIGSEDSWEQNSQYQPSPSPPGDAGLRASTLFDKGAAHQKQQQLAGTPARAVAKGTSGWIATLTPGPAAGSSSSRAGLATPRTVPRLSASGVGVLATPRTAGQYRGPHQSGCMTPAYYSSRAGNLVSGDLAAVAGGGEGDTVSGVLQLLGDAAGVEPSPSHHNTARSGFSSSSSSLAGTPDGPHGLRHGSYQGGYFTPVRPHRGSAAALLPASARPASRAAAWGTPAVFSGRNIGPGVSGSFSTVGAVPAAAHQQVPDTPLLKAGRNIAGVMFSPAHPAPLSMQQQQVLMSTPSHIQSLLPPPGSASKTKPAAMPPGSARTMPLGSAGAGISTGSGALPTTGSDAGMRTPPQAQQSSAAAAAALLGASSPAAAERPPATPQELSEMPGPPPAEHSSCSSMFDTQPGLLAPLFEDDGADMVTPCHTPRAGSPVGSPGGTLTSGSVGGLGSGALHSGASKLPASPPPAPARPVPGVVLVPTVEAESLYSSDDYVIPEEYMPEEYMPEEYILEEIEEGAAIERG